MLKKIIKAILPPFLKDKVRYYYWKDRPMKLSENIFFDMFQKKINWEDPRDLNEKIHWLKFYSDTSKWIELADKYKVREYVASCGLEYMLNELYAKYDRMEDIDIDNLPSSFVLKANNGCGDALVIYDKKKFTNSQIKKYFKRKLRNDNVVFAGETHYLKIPPCIIAEKILTEGSTEFSSSLIDYKILCINGQAESVLVCYNRTDTSVKLLSYDLNWNLKNEIVGKLKGTSSIPKPQSLHEMIRASEKLAKGFPLVRVDFYEIEGKPVFGEMTFTPGAGFLDYYTNESLAEMGSKVKLPEMHKS